MNNLIECFLYYYDQVFYLRFQQLYQDVWTMSSAKEKLASYEDIFNLMDELDIKVSRSEITDLVPLHNALLIHVSFLLTQSLCLKNFVSTTL